MLLQASNDFRVICVLFMTLYCVPVFLFVNLPFKVPGVTKKPIEEEKQIIIVGKKEVTTPVSGTLS